MAHNESITPRWLSVADACRYMSCGEKLLLGRLRDRLTIVKLPGTKKLRVDRESIDRLMLQNSEGAEALSIVENML
jgi:hypothetical protein